MWKDFLLFHISGGKQLSSRPGLCLQHNRAYTLLCCCDRRRKARSTAAYHRKVIFHGVSTLSFVALSVIVA